MCGPKRVKVQLGDNLWKSRRFLIVVLYHHFDTDTLVDNITNKQGIRI
jgi:hypothetical protein